MSVGKRLDRLERKQATRSARRSISGSRLRTGAIAPVLVGEGLPSQTSQYCPEPSTTIREK